MIYRQWRQLYQTAGNSRYTHLLRISLFQIRPVNYIHTIIEYSVRKRDHHWTPTMSKLQLTNTETIELNPPCRTATRQSDIKSDMHLQGVSDLLEACWLLNLWCPSNKIMLASITNNKTSTKKCMFFVHVTVTLADYTTHVHHTASHNHSYWCKSFELINKSWWNLFRNETYRYTCQPTLNQALQNSSHIFKMTSSTTMNSHTYECNILHENQK